MSTNPSESTDNTGGPAFPEAIAISPSGDVYPGYGGMTLRDWFAGQALAGFAAAHDQDGAWTSDAVHAAVRAYEHADAMLAERCK